jgi:two-component system cell cycle sensor histidine kinase/response regulator CckA
MQSAKQHVLLVDDEPQILLALEDLLGDDYTVFKSETPQRALELVRQNREIAVVITDQRMPHMNCDEFLSKIGDQSQALRIMVSGFADLPAVLRAINDGRVYAYVTKPWDEHDLLRKVRTAADHFRLAQQLEYERRLLRDLMDNSPDGIYFKDADLRFLRANGSFARAIGCATPNELVGKRLSDLLGPDNDHSATDAEDQLVLRERRPILDTVREQYREGRRHFISETKAAIQNASGVAIGLVGISRDVTERIETSEALRESEAMLQQQTRILNSILDGMGDGVVVIGRDGRTLLFNKAAGRVLGLDTRDVAAEAWPETYGLYLNDGKTRLSEQQNPLCRAMRGEPLVEMDLRVANAAVAGAFVAILATPLKEPDGTIAGAIALLRDVTRQRNLEQQLAQSQKMEAIGQLAGGVAHDFNNLLTVIVGCGELALEEFAAHDPQRDNLVEVLAAARRATLLTQQLLAFSRQQVIQPEEIQLNDVVAGFESMLRRLMPSEIVLSTVLRPGLSLITADKSQLEQVILNLAINARDAMPEGGTLRIETDEETLSDSAAAELGAPRGRFVALTLTDTGSGMSDETRKRIFEPFFTTKEVGKGTGLGLSTVYGIVRQSGGYVRVLSAPDEGTEFRILLPRSTRHGQILSSLPPKIQDTISARILVVENDDSVRQIAARMLRSEGHSVLDASNLADARVFLADRASRIEVLLIDVGMAKQTFQAEIAAALPDIRVLLMTGGGSTLSHSGAPIAEPALLAKPFSRAQLLEKVQAVLARGPGRA